MRQSYEVTDRHEPSAWLRDQINLITERHRTRMFGACPHYSDTVVSYTPLWDSECRMCRSCVMDLAPEGEADSTCDRCGSHVEVIYPIITAAAFTVVIGGLCGDCLEREVGSA